MVIKDLKDHNGLWKKSAMAPDGLQVLTRAGVLWMNMLRRCDPCGAEQRKNPTYIGCYHKFLDFQDFAEWC